MQRYTWNGIDLIFCLTVFKFNPCCKCVKSSFAPSAPRSVETWLRSPFTRVSLAGQVSDLVLLPKVKDTLFGGSGETKREGNVLFSCERSYATLWIIIGRLLLSLLSGKHLQPREAWEDGQLRPLSSNLTSDVTSEVIWRPQEPQRP